MRRFFLLGSSIAFSGGITLGLFFNLIDVQVVLLLCIGLAIAFSLVFRTDILLSVCWIGACVLMGALVASQTMKDFQVLGEEKSLQGFGMVRGEAIQGTFGNRVVVSLYDCGERKCPRKYVLLRTSQYEPLIDGVKVHIGPCDLKRPEQFDARFDYPMYLAKEGIGFVSTQCPLEFVSTPSDRLRRGLHEVRVYITSIIAQRIPEPEAGLARGLILGGSDELPETLARDFRIVGLSHIVAVSGYNISVLAGGFFLLGIGFGWYRKRAVWLALLGTALFVLLVGAPASAIRAALVSVAGFGAFLVARPVSAIPILCLAAALMLAINPLLLRYDIGFQLSFLATFAILFSAPWRSRFQKRSWLGGYLLEAFLITLSVLLFVTPLTLIYFGTLSPYALLANMGALPLVPAAFFLSCLVVLFGWIPGFGAFAGWCAYGILHFLVVIAEIIAHLPGADMTFTEIRWWVVVLWYGFWLLFFLWQNTVRKKSQDDEAI